MRNFVRHKAEIPVQVIHNKKTLEFSLINVSLGGIACKGENRLDTGTEVEVIFDLLKPVYKCNGVVVWCKEDSEPPADCVYEIGIEHRGEKDRDRFRMVEHISHIEHYRNEVKHAEGRDLTGEAAAREWVSIHMDTL